jgi:hypothetical protein
MDTDLSKASKLPLVSTRERDVVRWLRLRLKAERETREAIIHAARNGASGEVIEAIASDPIPVEAIVGLGQAERIPPEDDTDGPSEVDPYWTASPR